VLGDTSANAGTRRPADPSAQDRAVASSYRLAYGGTCRPTDGATNDGPALTRAVGGDCRARGSTDSSANHGPIASPDRLTKHRTCGCANAAAKERADVIGVCRMHQGKQGHRRHQSAY
jgi:hypothetical protein